MKVSEKLVSMLTNKERAEYIFKNYFIFDKNEMKDFENWLNSEVKNGKDN